MSIRKTLLIAFLLVSLLPSILLTYLAFSVAGSAMHGEIEQSLRVEAATVSQDIDKMLFERLQNAQIWNRLEVMQDIQISDVDKRLSNFLAELKSGYPDVYHELLCTDDNGRVVASSNPAAIGTILPKEDGTPLSDSQVMLGMLRLSGNGSNAALPIRSAVPSMFKSGEIGKLHLMFNWAQIYRILDQAAQGSRSVILLDRDGRIIAASSRLRDQGFLLKAMPAAWRNEGLVAVHDGSPLGLHDITSSASRSHGFQHFAGFGWTTLVIQPSQQAFIPVRHMAMVFLLLLALTSAIAVGVSMLIANRIASPITSLTEFTRRFMRNQALPPPPVHVGGEVGELSNAFVQMVQDLEQSREKLVRASKLAVVGEMAAVMAHEVRTPLGILRSSSQMLAREPGISPEGQELVGFIESETERLNRLVSTLLDSARPRAPRIEATDMHALIHHVISMLAAQAEKKGIAVEEQLSAQQPLAGCDREQITQVLLNLVLNALQIVPDGGRVSVACKESGGKLLIEVADNGPGIPTEDRARVFDPFFTRREGGFGLGLAVVQGIIAAHGGTISAGVSDMGGALFTVILPHTTNEEA